MPQLSFALACLLSRIWIEAARTERSPKYVEIMRKSIHHRIRDFYIRVSCRTRFLSIELDKFFNPVDALQ